MADSNINDAAKEDVERNACDKDASPGAELSRLRERLRGQLTCLGIAWLLFGGVRVWAAFDAPEPDVQLSPYGGLVPSVKVAAQTDFDWHLASGAGFIIVGILVWGRVVWALYLALALTYVEMLQAVLRQDTLMVAVWIPLAIYAHWTVRRMYQLRRAGIAISDTQRSVLTIRGGR